MNEPEQGENNRRPAIVGLGIAVVLLVAGLWLAHEVDRGQQNAGLPDVRTPQLQRD